MSKNTDSVGLLTGTPLHGAVGLTPHGHTLGTNLSVGWVPLVLKFHPYTGRGKPNPSILSLKSGPLVELGRPEIIPTINSLTFVNATGVRAV
jgi:hypothetical protein